MNWLLLVRTSGQLPVGSNLTITILLFFKNEHRVVQHVMVRCGDVSKCFVVNFRTHRLIAGIKTIKIFQNFLTCFIRNFDH